MLDRALCGCGRAVLSADHGSEAGSQRFTPVLPGAGCQGRTHSFPPGAVLYLREEVISRQALTVGALLKGIWFCFRKCIGTVGILTF